MIQQPKIPDEVIVGTRKYSWLTDMKVNGWLLIAAVVGAANNFLFHSEFHVFSLREHFSGWPLVVRVLVELCPLLLSLLWVRRLRGWVGGMDELHRRITLDAWFRATLITIGILSIWPLLDAAGVSAAILAATNGLHLEALDKPNLPLTLGILWLNGLLCHFFINRRYQ